ncbi:MAG: hypothetical protein HYT62_00520 [Candidatus Yanofskybacteria bacterium]|nr:hypothetical protein [Candidatus Yanofskybacteria bacterium]
MGEGDTITRQIVQNSKFGIFAIRTFNKRRDWMSQQDKFSKGDFVETSLHEPGIVQEDGRGRLLVEVWGVIHAEKKFHFHDISPISRQEFEILVQSYGYNIKTVLNN